MTSIIAELCQNHNGDLDILRKMVDTAADAGASHIKIQHILTKNLVYRPAFEKGLIDNEVTYAIKRPWQTEYDRLKKLELSLETCDKFIEHVTSCGLIPLTTCFARCDIKDIVDRGFDEIKVASYDCASYQMIRELASHFPKIYISTGASYDGEIQKASEVVAESNSSLTMLHCVTIYPTPLEEMNLNRLSWLKKYSPVIGFSDHSDTSDTGILASKAAIYMGASVIERHFTVLDSSATRDGKVSINSCHIKELREFASLPRSDMKSSLDDENPNWQIMLGNSQRELSSTELLNRDYYRGRFASPIYPGRHSHTQMIFNWEETEL